MADLKLSNVLIRLHHYLSHSIPALPNFKEEIVDILLELDRNIIRTSPYHLIISIDDPSKWFFSYIATYGLNSKRISVEVIAYLDRKVVRFMKGPSRLKFDDKIPELQLLTPQEIVASYFISERYNLPMESLLCPKKNQAHSQRLLRLIDKILKSEECAQGFVELLLLLREILDHCGEEGSEIGYILDEILILLDDFTLQDTSLLNLVKWKKLLTIKFKALIIYLDPKREYHLHFRRKFVLIGLLLITPFLDGVHFQGVLLSLQERIKYMTGITLSFLESLIEEMENCVIKSTHLDRYLIWESSLVTFFAYNRNACFADSS